METPTTTLEAVNIMLGTIGESPVSTLTGSGLVDVATAQSVLTETSRQLQAKGWNFNSEENYELALTVEGYLKPPINTLRIDSSDGVTDVVHRGDKLYDRYNHTFVFTQALKCDLVLFLPFEDLPESARRFIAIRAARRFQRRILGSESIDAFTAEDESEAKADFMDADAESADINVLKSSAATRVLQR